MNRLLLLLTLTMILAGQTIRQGIESLEQKNYEQAREIFETILNEDDENEKAWFYLGQAYYHLEDYSESVDCFDEIVNDESTNIDHLKWYAKANRMYVEEASIFSKMSIAKNMAKTFRRIVELDPNDIDAETNLIGFLLNAPSIAGGDEDEALKRIQSLEKKAPVPANRLLLRFYIKNENFDKAKASITRLEAHPEKLKKHYTLYNEYGYFLLNHGKNAEALRAFMKQTELAPNHANAYDSLGDGYRALNDKANAIASYKKALELDPNFETSRKNLDDLEDE